MKNKAIPILLGIIVICNLSFAQIYTEPDPSAEFNKSKSILVFYPDKNGTLYFNDYSLKEFQAFDTIYIANINPGQIKLKIVSDDTIIEQEISFKGGKVYKLYFQSNTLTINQSIFYEDVADDIKGRKFYYFSKKSYFNIIQTSLYAIYIGDQIENNKFFNTFTLINGFQIRPGFSPGIGISYEIYDLPLAEYNYYINTPIFTNVSFLPVFLDIRIHFSARRVTSFIKLDIGYSSLLINKSMSEEYENEDYEGNVHKYINTFEVYKGGFYISPGIGLRIGINKYIQIILAADYSSESFLYNTIQDYYYNNSLKNSYEYTTKYNLKSFEFKIGIGFQK